MKIQFFIAIFCFILPPGLLFGQEHGSFRIRDLRIRLDETDSVEVMFSIEFMSNSATRNGGLLLTPTILDTANKVTLASIYAEKSKGRSGKLFRGKETIPDSLVMLKINALTHYSNSIPFENWMNGAKMELDIVRISRKKSVILSKVLRNNLVLKNKKVVNVETKRKAWKVTDKLEFIFSPQGISKDIVESIVSGDHSAAIEALLKLEESPNVWNALGVAYGYSGEYDKARYYLEMVSASPKMSASPKTGQY